MLVTATGEQLMKVAEWLWYLGKSNSHFSLSCYNREKFMI